MSVIDRFVVELALDPKKFSGPAKQAVEDLRTFEKQAGNTGNSIEGVGRKGADAFAGVRREALAMFAVFTAGRSLKAFVSDTTKANTQLDYMSQRLNMDPGGLTRLETAAKAAGGTFGEVTQSFAALQQRLTDPQQWAQVTRAFTQLGVTDFTDKNGKVRPDVINLVRDGVKRNHIDHAVATGYMRDLGFGDGAINQVFMNDKQYRELQRELANIPTLSRQELENSRELYQSLTILRQESEQYTNALVANLSPALTKVIRQFEDWEHEHPTLAAGIGGITLAVGELNASLGGLVGLLTSLAGVSILKRLFGGDKKALKAVLEEIRAAKAGGVASEVGTAARTGGTMLFRSLGLGALTIGEGLSLNSDINNDRRRVGQAYEASTHKAEHQGLLYQAMIRSGYSRNAALGVLGNLEQESGLNAGATGDRDWLGNPTAFGIAQWHKPRIDDIKKRFGIDVRTAGYEDQVRALILEMKSGGDAGARQANAALSDPGISIADSVRAFRKNFERPLNADGQEDIRRMALAVDAGHSVAAPPRYDATNNTTNFHGDIVINTQATDAKGVAKAFDERFNRRSILAVNSPGLQ